MNTIPNTVKNTLITTVKARIRKVLPVLVFIPGLAFSQLIVEGHGTTRDMALSDAKRNAVEQGVGVIVASQTKVTQSTLEDVILSKANGFVKNYQELSAAQASDGLWTVKISAEVTDILDELVQDQIALDLLLSWVKHPRFMVMIDEQNVDDPNTTIAETEIGRIMGGKGFDIYSPTQTKALKERNVNLAQLQDDPAAAVALANEFGAEYLVMGNARSIALTNPLLGSRFSGQGNITAQVIRADNAQILAQETFHGKATHVDPITAGMYALKDAGEQLSNYLVAETVRRWSLEQSNARTITLRINGVAYRDKRLIINYLKNEVEGVQAVDQRSFAAGLLTVALQYGGSNEDLGGVLDGHALGDFTLYISGETPNGFDLTVEK
ncbi:MAG: hypothetical protein GXO90_08425 [FCB group bacterium]|nr:hypothetical protein [FCB group bacterium]